MSKVYIVQDDPNKNLTTATKFGELKALLPFKQIVFDTKKYLDIVRNGLKDFNPPEDYILLIGDPIAITLVSVAISESFKVLKWDRDQGNYFPITINL